VYAAQTAMWYGDTNLGRIYPFVFMFYGFSGIASAPLAGFIYERFDSYSPSFILSLMLLSIAIIGSLKGKQKPIQV
jgi:OFA family oxalate/formate antiporter-like MFS transporter